MWRYGFRWHHLFFFPFLPTTSSRTTPLSSYFFVPPIPIAFPTSFFSPNSPSSFSAFCYSPLPPVGWLWTPPSCSPGNIQRFLTEGLLPALSTFLIDHYWGIFSGLLPLQQILVSLILLLTFQVLLRTLSTSKFVRFVSKCPNGLITSKIISPLQSVLELLWHSR